MAAQDTDQPPPRPEDEIEQELRQGCRATAQELMARLAGPGAMKGVSPVSPVQQAETAISSWLGDNLADASGALRVVLQRQIKGSELLLDSVEAPLNALAEYCRCVLASDNLLKEIVREADAEWGRSMDEQPHFEREGVPADPDDPYTCEYVRQALADAIKKLSIAAG